MSGAKSRSENLPRLRKNEAPGRGLKRVMIGCLVAAEVDAPGERRESRAKRIHEARLALKRARALLRLGELLGLEWAGEARRDLAQRARELSAPRDAEVLRKMALRLAPVLTGSGRRCAMDLVARASLEAEGSGGPTVAPSLRTIRAQLARRSWPELTPREIERALRRSLRRLRKRQRAARETTGSEAMHEWRKATIVLREQLTILRPLLSRAQRACVARLQRVAQRLGQAGDWALLATAARQMDSLEPTGRARVVAVAEEARRPALVRAQRAWRKARRELRQEFGRR